ncbi:hypothetical protein AGMMS50239_20790 [Bacteroidia bacterium]|nr:hypothetical protein AGMMS50239_20790 [Bacteroidia bacterium]
MKILHIIFSFNIGGAETMLVDILNEQVKYQNVGLIIINKDYNEDLLKKISPEVSLFFLNRKIGSKNPLKIITFNLIIRRYNPQVIHFHNHNAIGLLMPIRPYKKILTVHDLRFPPKYFKKYGTIVAISHAVQKDIFNSSGLESTIVYNGICLDKIKVKTKIENNVFRIVQIGRLIHLKKGQHILLKALSLLVEKYKIDRFSLDFIGSGDSEFYLKELVKEYKLENHVCFLGEQSREEIYINLHNYDLLVQPSIYEGFGLTVAEAMAAKVPVLVSANDGPMEIIEDGKYGFWFEKENAEHCCEQIKQILSSENIDEFLNNAYLHVSKNFNIVNVASQYIKTYTEKHRSNILITAPSLDVRKNISGISSVVQSIIKHNNQCNYTHYLLGRPDKKLTAFSWLMLLIKQLILFPFALKKNKIDIVHQNLPFDPKGILREFVINWWCKLLNIPVVLHIHGGVFLMNKTTNKFYDSLSKRIFKNSRVVVVLSEIEKEALRQNYQYPSASVLVNCIDISLFSEIKKKEHNPTPVFLFLGRLHESKGLEDIVNAFKLLKADVKFDFILCGDGPLREYIVSECKSLLKDQFKYLGVVSGQIKLNIIQSADYFLLPSRYGEGLPIALLETMAVGLVPIITDDASMKYVVENGQNGVIVEKRNPQDLYQKIKKVVSTPGLYQFLSTHAKESVVEKYDIQDYVSRLNDIYEKCLCR